MLLSRFVGRGSVAVLQKTCKSIPVIAPKLSRCTMTTSSTTGRYDLVVFGATGFTGQYVVEEVARVAEGERGQPPLRWAVAGRSKEKLLKVIEVARKETGLPLVDVDMLEADVSDPSSLDNMTSRARVLVNCVGPYYKYGEPVVLSCVQNGADHVDISGESVFLEGMQLKYDKVAEEKGVHIVGSCGFDSIPSEIGMHVLQEKFPGGLNSVEQYGTSSSSTGKFAPTNTGTLESAMLFVSTRGELRSVHQQLFPTKLPPPKYPGRRPRIHHNPDLHYYGIPLPSDAPIVYRTQRYRHDVEGLPPVQFAQFIALRSALVSVGAVLGAIYFYIMASMSWTRSLMLRYPKVLTAGLFSRGDASREDLRSMSFTTTLVGKGWRTGEEGKQNTPPDTTKILKIHGPDPAYSATSIFLVAAAMTLLREKSSCTKKGGVLTPGVAFARTAISKRITDRGVVFQFQE